MLTRSQLTTAVGFSFHKFLPTTSKRAGFKSTNWMLRAVQPLSITFKFILNGLPFSTSSLIRPSEMDLVPISKSKCFGGEQRFYTHYSRTLDCKMDLTIYLPPKTVTNYEYCPVLYFLNGLTATHENFVQKSGFQRFAADLGICVVCPDTSPREVEVPKHDVLGPGGSFYMDAITEPWSDHYQMFTYVTEELVKLVTKNFPVVKDTQSISGFSMGGFGALNCFLKCPGLYKSVSAFAPPCNPISGGIVKQALELYLGDKEEEWEKWDPCVLVEKYNSGRIKILIDQGTCDEWTEGGHLRPENFVIASEKNPLVKTVFKQREGYNHSHYYLATFIEEHMKYHAKALRVEC